jgi:hypothetical protein
MMQKPFVHYFIIISIDRVVKKASVNDIHQFGEGVSDITEK